MQVLGSFRTDFTGSAWYFVCPNWRSASGPLLNAFWLAILGLNIQFVHAGLDGAARRDPPPHRPLCGGVHAAAARPRRPGAPARQRLVQRWRQPARPLVHRPETGHDVFVPGALPTFLDMRDNLVELHCDSEATLGPLLCGPKLEACQPEVVQ